MRCSIITAFATVATLAAGPALAVDVHAVVLTNGMATIDEVNAKVGDRVAFYHLDENDAHQLYSTDENHRFDVKHIFKHGDHFDIELTHPGSFDVKCHAMPHMVIKINVSE